MKCPGCEKGLSLHKGVHWWDVGCPIAPCVAECLHTIIEPPAAGSPPHCIKCGATFEGLTFFGQWGPA